MKTVSLLIYALLALPAAGQNQSTQPQELPEAPSARLTPKPVPKPPAAPQQTAPAQQPAAPVQS